MTWKFAIGSVKYYKNEMIKKEWFLDIPSLKDLCKDIQKLLKGQTQKGS